MSNFNFAPSNSLRYKVFKEGRVVKAYIDDTEHDAANIINTVLCKTNTKFIDTYVCDRNSWINPSYSSHARCNSDAGDVFDEEVGKEIARSRVLDHYHRDIHRKLCAALEDLRGFCASLEHYCDKHGVDYSNVKSVESIKENRFSCK